MELLEAVPLIVGGSAGGFGGAYAAIRVHIGYITRDNARQDKKIDEIERRLVSVDNKATRAHVRLDHIAGVMPE